MRHRVDQQARPINQRAVGGVKSSGFGVEFGEEGLFENTDAQVVWS
jgi:acyl-CoA reductase-like NAD-dependent aldehyde dehydrogenase